MTQAYRSIPRDIGGSRRGVGSRRSKNNKRPKIPPAFKGNAKEDHTLCLLLKHLRNGPHSKLPSVNSNAEIRAATDFLNSRQSYRKDVSVNQYILYITAIVRNLILYIWRLGISNTLL